MDVCEVFDDDNPQFGVCMVCFYYSLDFGGTPDCPNNLKASYEQCSDAMLSNESIGACDDDQRWWINIGY